MTTGFGFALLDGLSVEGGETIHVLCYRTYCLRLELWVEHGSGGGLKALGRLPLRLPLLTQFLCYIVALDPPLSADIAIITNSFYPT